MSDAHVGIWTLLAATEHTRVEIGQDGVLHVRAGAVTLHLDAQTCEELTTTLARAMVMLIKARKALRRRPRLALVPNE